MNFPRCFGDCRPHPIGRPEELHSSWSTELKQSCRVIFSTMLLELRSTTKQKLNKRGKILEEEREMALIRSTIYQQDLRRFHARNVKSRAFQEGDLVLRVDQHKQHKLAPSWEGPFIVTKVLHNGAYRLYNIEHNIDEPRAWNAELLRPFYT